MTDADAILVTCESGVLTVALNRPDRMNAITPAMMEDLEHIFASRVNTPDATAVVITGTGRSFCTGADLKADQQRTAAESRRLMEVTNHIIELIVKCPKPVIAAVNGPAAGFGVSLAVAADLAIASTSAYFLLAFARVGLMPDGGATALIAASIGRARALRMMLLGQRVTAAEAADLGLIAETVDDDALHARITELTDHVAGASGPALRHTKDAVNAATLAGLGDALVRERDGQLELMDSEDFLAAAASFAQRSKNR